jgi:hypothetical protein
VLLDINQIKVFQQVRQEIEERLHLAREGGSLGTWFAISVRRRSWEDRPTASSNCPHLRSATSSLMKRFMVELGFVKRFYLPAWRCIVRSTPKRGADTRNPGKSRESMDSERVL